MSMWYESAFVSILKCTASPRLTLMSVAKPWIDGSPASPLGMSHCAWGVPGSAFSTWMGLSARAVDAVPSASANASETADPHERTVRPECERCMFSLPESRSEYISGARPPTGPALVSVQQCQPAGEASLRGDEPQVVDARRRGPRRLVAPVPLEV